MSGYSMSEEIARLGERAGLDVQSRFPEIDDVSERCTAGVLGAFQRHRVSAPCFAPATGYGYADTGRDTLDAVYADVFGAEAAIVRAGFANGTHAVTAALFGALRPGDTLLSVTGAPYDTLRGAIGIEGGYVGSMREYGIGYAQIELTDGGRPDTAAIAAAAADSSVAAVLVQRSRGYTARRALSVDDTGEIAGAVRAVNARAAVIVDNCYGEFTEPCEPTHAGADLVAGSLIKNPGGGLAPAGGYIAGRSDLVEAAAFRLTSPGIGGECGPNLTDGRLLYQGLFMAPHTVAQALKTAIFCARLMELLGYRVNPGWNAPRHDIIQSVELGRPELLEAFCRGIQAGAPVDAFAVPEAWDMPGYGCPVIMAAGTFVQGASIELSADGPMRPPYTAYLQGGLTYEAGKIGVMTAAQMLTGSGAGPDAR
ncbi:MAG: methionine gamma-lyase family protein [Oscillospiraceae bacterium]|jgi:cystathionine beta-lyase family protein involved in aluminum resistance|nr:methionine gamma-lyase family protein [Oscillospiraceae bacterium]